MSLHTNSTHPDVELEDFDDEDFEFDEEIEEDQLDDLIFTLRVPEEDDRGYIGFLDDMVEISELFEKAKDDPKDFKLADWRKIRTFVEALIVEPADATERRALIRSMSLNDFMNVFEQIDASEQAKKNSTRQRHARSTMRQKGSKPKRRQRGHG